MPRPLFRSSLVTALLGAALTLPLLLGSAHPARAAEPELETFLDTVRAEAEECDEWAPDSWLCVMRSGDVYAYTDLIDSGSGLTIQPKAVFWEAGAPMSLDAELFSQWSDLVTLALGADSEAHAWLADMNEGPEPAGEFSSGGWQLSWRSAAGDGSADVGLDLLYWPDTEAPDPSVATPRPVAPAPAGEIDACALLTEADVASVTGLDASDGALAETRYGTSVYCFFGTEPYDIGISHLALGLSVEEWDAGYADVTDGGSEPIPDLGDSAWWSWCDECIWSTNRLDLLAQGSMITIIFEPTSQEAGEASASVQTQHREWAVALARLIVPRLASAIASEEPVPSAAAAPAAPSDAPAPAPAVPSSGSRDAEPFADAVPTIAEVSGDPMILLQSGLLAALVVFLMPFPAQLFNSTLETHEDEVKRWFRLDRLGALAGGIGAFWVSWPGVALFTTTTALLYGFLDPGFGISLDSVATFVGMLLGIVLVTAAFAVPAVLAHRRIGDMPTLKVVPISLIIGVACVLLSRLTDFQPGYLYGLLIGLVFARELSEADEGRTTAIGAALMLLVAFGSWLALGTLPTGDGFITVVARTSLAALMVAGLEGVVFGLLPMRFLPGEPLYRWNRVLWAGLLLIGAFAFFHILINPASGYLSDTSRTPLLTVVALLAGFSLVSVSFWAWFRFRLAPSPAETSRR